MTSRESLQKSALLIILFLASDDLILSSASRSIQEACPKG